MSATNEQIAELHAWYGKRTGVVTKLFFAQRLWFDLLRSYNYAVEELRADADLVIRHLKKEIARDKRNLGALKPANFLQPDNFDADLAVARLAVKAPSTSMRPKASAEEIASNVDGTEVAVALRAFRQSLAAPKSQISTDSN